MSHQLLLRRPNPPGRKTAEATVALRRAWLSLTRTTDHAVMLYFASVLTVHRVTI